MKAWIGDEDFDNESALDLFSLGVILAGFVILFLWGLFVS